VSRLDYGNATLAGLRKPVRQTAVGDQFPQHDLFALNESTNTYNAALRDLHWLPVRERIEFKLAVLVFRCLHGTAPPCLANELCRVDARRRLPYSSLSSRVYFDHTIYVNGTARRILWSQPSSGVASRVMSIRLRRIPTVFPPEKTECVCIDVNHSQRTNKLTTSVRAMQQPNFRQLVGHCHVTVSVNSAIQAMQRDAVMVAWH